jgi:hypothetical protein
VKQAAAAEATPPIHHLDTRISIVYPLQIKPIHIVHSAPQWSITTFLRNELGIIIFHNTRSQCHRLMTYMLYKHYLSTDIVHNLYKEQHFKGII